MAAEGTPELRSTNNNNEAIETTRRTMASNNKHHENQGAKRVNEKMDRKPTKRHGYGEHIDLSWLVENEDHKLTSTFILNGDDDPYQGSFDEHPTIEDQYKLLKNMTKVNSEDTQKKRQLFWDMYDIDIGGKVQARQIERNGSQLHECVLNWEVAYTNFIESAYNRTNKENDKDKAGDENPREATFIVGAEKDPYKGNYGNHPSIKEQHEKLYFMEKVNVIDTQQKRQEFWEMYEPDEINEDVMLREIEEEGETKIEIIVNWEKAYSEHIKKLQKEVKEKVGKKKEEWSKKRKEGTWYDLSNESDSTSEAYESDEIMEEDEDKLEIKATQGKYKALEEEGWKEINNKKNYEQKSKDLIENDKKNNNIKNNNDNEKEKKNEKEDNNKQNDNRNESDNPKINNNIHKGNNDDNINKGYETEENEFQLAMGQLEYSLEKACEGIEHAPRHRQIIEIGLKVNGQDLSETGWLTLFKQFYALMKEGDVNSTILRRRPQSKRNSITRIEEIPTTQKELEQDYVFDVNITEEGTRLRLRMITATTITFARLFKSRTLNNVYQKLMERDWYVKQTSLTTQGPRKTMGWLKGLHPVFTNFDNLLMEIKALLMDISPHIEVYPKNEKKYYKQEENEEIVQKLEARIICLSAPKDICDQMMAIMGKRLKQLKDQKPPSNHSTLRNSQFIPNSKKISQQSQIVHLREHLEECQRFNEPIQIYNCKTIDKEFAYPDELARYTTQKGRVGKPTTIRKILLRLKLEEEETKKKVPIVHLIEQRDEQRFAILISKDIMSRDEARRVIFEIVTILRKEVDGWPIVCATRGGLMIDGEEDIEDNENEQYIEELQVEDKKLIPITSREYRNRYETRGRPSNRGRGRGNTHRDRKWTERDTETHRSNDAEMRNNAENEARGNEASYKDAVMITEKRRNEQPRKVRNDAMVIGGGDRIEPSKGVITLTNENGEIELPGTIERYLNNKISMAVSSAIHKVNEDNRKQNMEIMEKVEKNDNRIEQTTKQMEEIQIAQATTENNIRENEKTINDTKQSIEKIEEAVQMIQETNNITNITEIQNQVREESEATRNMIREMMKMMSKNANQPTTTHQQSEVQQHQQGKDQQATLQKENYIDDTQSDKMEPETVTTTQETVSTITKPEGDDDVSDDEYNMKSIKPYELIECLDKTPQRNQAYTKTATPQRYQKDAKQITPSKRTKQERSSDEDSDEDTITTPKIQRIMGPIRNDEKVEINNKINITHIIKSKDNKGTIQNTNNTINNNSNQPEPKEKKHNKANTTTSPYNTRSQKPTRAGKPKVGENSKKEPHYTPKKQKGASRWGGNP